MPAKSRVAASRSFTQSGRASVRRTPDSPAGMLFFGLGMAALPCCAEKDVEAGSAAPACRLAGIHASPYHITATKGGIVAGAVGREDVTHASRRRTRPKRRSKPGAHRRLRTVRPSRLRRGEAHGTARQREADRSAADARQLAEGAFGQHPRSLQSGV